MEPNFHCSFGAPNQYICRVCLSTERKLYHLLGCGLQNYFHDITGIQISSNDGFPQYICYVCRELLRKAVAFRNKSINTQNKLKLRQIHIRRGRIPVMIPLIAFVQTGTLLISIPPLALTDEIDTANLVDASLIKEEECQESDVNTEHQDNSSDTETFVKEEVNENLFDNGADFDMDVEVTSNENNVSNEREVVDMNGEVASNYNYCYLFNEYNESKECEVVNMNVDVAKNEDNECNMREVVSMNVEQARSENSESNKPEVVNETNATKIFDGKAKPKQKAKSNKNTTCTNPNKADIEIDAQTLKDYLVTTNTEHVFAEMLRKYIISKYIDETKTYNTDIDQTKDEYELIDSEDETTPVNKLIKVEDELAKISNILTSQTDMEPSKKILYEFIKERYVEKTKPTNKRRAKYGARNKLKTDKRLLKRQMALEDLKNKGNMEIKVLSFEEQIAEVKNRLEIYKTSRFRCEECFRGFLFEKTYNCHMRSHDPAKSGNIKCEVCKKRFFNKTQASRHQLSHKYQFICKVCGCITKTYYLAREHAKSHSGQNIFKCEHCSRVFSKSKTRINHIRIKHGTEQCEICYDLMAPSGLRLHNILRHKETFKCQSCDKVFNDANALEKHKSYSVDGICNSNERLCTFCGESFTSESKWMSHIQEHRAMHRRRRKLKHSSKRSDFSDTQPGTRRSSADECSEFDPGRNVMCEICGKTFSHPSVLRDHQRMHTGEMPFLCAHCPKRFRVKFHLKVHLNTHTGERPYQCPVCQKRFKCYPTLHRHKSVHMSERPHRCTYCDKTYRTLRCVKSHIKTVHLKGLKE